MEKETKHRKNGFYLIKINDFPERDSEPIEKWSVGYWDGKCFEELNEFYYETEVLEVNENEISGLPVENERLRQAYDYILSSRNNVDQELKEAQTELSEMKTENTRLKSELLHRDVTVLPQKDLEYEEMKASLQSEIDRLKEAHMHEMKAAHTLRAELSEMKKERGELIGALEEIALAYDNGYVFNRRITVIKTLLNRIKK